jgi:hypothetical protein
MGGKGKQMLGGFLMLVGVLIFTDGDTMIESIFVAASSAGLADLMTFI